MMIPPVPLGTSQDGSPRFVWESEAPPASSTFDATPLEAVLRHKWAILGLAVLLTALASVVVRRLPVGYDAAASVMVDARKPEVLQDPRVPSSPVFDLDRLRTDMEELRSPAIAQAVVTQLDLTHEPEYCRVEAAGLTARLRALLHGAGAGASTPCDVSPEAAAEHVLGAVSASNDGRSYIIKVGATAGSPALASRIANAYAHAFVAGQRQRDIEAATQADSWLTNYLAELSTQVLAADAAVEAYRRQNQLTPLHGETVTSQRLSELNSQLTVATAALAEKQAALHQVQAIAKGGSPLDASAPAVLASPLIQQLIGRQSDLLAAHAQLRTRYGDAHPEVQATAAQLDKLGRSIQGEIGRTIAGLGDEVAALAARRASIAADVGQLQVQTGDQGTAGMRLQELQRDADADHRLYESMTTRLHEVDAERHMQWPASSVVVEATPPKVASFPRVNMMLAGTFMMSLGLGGFLAFLFSLTSRVFRDVDQVERETGARVLGLFPRPPRRSSPVSMVLDQPGSLETETLGFVLANLMRGTPEGSEKGRMIMVSSALPGEGKSSFTVALGQVAARAGLSVLVVDCDMRSLGATRILKAESALAAGASGERSTAVVGASAVPVAIERSGMHLLAMEACVPDARRLLGSSDLSAILRRLHAQYDLVLIDTPPILAVADALALAPLTHEMLLVLDWRQTPRHQVSATMKAMRRHNVDVAGIVLSKVDLRQFAKQSAGGLFARGYSGYGRPVRAQAGA